MRCTLLVMLSLLLTACAPTQRRIVVTSEPTGARVHLNDVDVGVTPVEVDFTYFGVYDVRLAKPGFEPLWEARKAEAPLHEWPGVDLIAMAIPGQEKTEIAWHFVMSPSETDPEGLIERAREVRGKLGAGQGEESW